ncbi:MAG: hypothetical protein ChlgKO_12780 [Chlamydiales bacterium]
MNNITRFPVRYFQRTPGQHPLNKETSLTQRIQNFCSSSQPTNTAKKLFVISGSGATTARSLILKALAVGDVIGLSSKDLKKSEVPGLKFVQLSSEDLKNPAVVAKKIQSRITEQGEIHYEKISALNLIGGALAPKDSSLEILNKDLPSGFFRGVHMLAENMSSSFAMGGISSIAARISSSDCKYASVKRAADEAFCELGEEFGASTTILRPGIILENFSSEERLSPGHDYSPEQFSNKFIHMLVGSGNQLQQPVTVDCLFDALLNGLDIPGQRVVNAVSDKALTMRDLFMRFSRRKTVIQARVPYFLAEHAVEIAPRGRFQSYAIQMLKEQDMNPEKNVPICSKDFSELLTSKKPISFEEFYKPQVDLVVSPPPYLEHLTQYSINLFEKMKKHIS